MAYKVFNASTQGYDFADHTQLPAMLASGQYRLVPGEKVRMFSPDGQTFEGDAQSNWADLAKSGFQIEDPALRDQRAQLTEAGEHPLLAAGLGAARGATFGLSDVGLKGAGVGDYANALKEANPIASTVGEVGGVLGSAVLAPEASLVGGVGELGAGVTAKVAGAFGADLGASAFKGATMATAKELAARMAGRAAGGAVEGALYGTGQTITEAALGDPDAAGEHFVQNVGLSSLIGAAVPGALGMFGDLARGAFAKGVRETGQKVIDKWMGAVQDIKGMNSEDFQKLGKDFFMPGDAADFRDKVFGYAFDPEQANINISDGLKDLNNVAKELSYKVSGDFSEALSGVGTNSIPYAQNATKPIDDAINLLKSQRSTLIRAAKGPDAALYDTGVLRKLAAIKRIGIDDLSKLYDAENFTDADIQNALYKNRSEAGKFTADYYDKKVLAPNQAYTKKNIINPDLGGLNDFLRDPERFGPAATANADADKTVSGFLGAHKEFMKNFATDGEINPGKIKAFYNNPTSASNFKKQQVFDKYFSAIDDLTKVSGDTGAMGSLAGIPSVNDETKALLAHAQQLKTSTEEIRAAIKGTQIFQQYTGKNNEFLKLGSILGGAAGFMAGGPAGAAAGASLGASAGWLVNNPVSIMRVMTRVERGILNNKSAMGEKINRFLGGVPVNKAPEMSVTREGAMNALSQLISGMNSDDKSTADISEKKYPSMITQLQAIDPQALLERVHGNLGPLNTHAPNVAMATGITAARGLQYLQQESPKAPMDQVQFGPLQSAWEPSTMEKAKFARQVEAVMSPIGTLSKLKDGTLTQDHVQAIQAVYPNLYAEMHQNVVDALSNRTNPLSFQKKLQLGTLMQMPTVNSMNPQFLTSLQTSLAYVEQQNAKIQSAKGSPLGSTQIQQAMN